VTLARRRRQLAHALLLVLDVRPGDSLGWYQHRRVVLQLRILATHAQRLGLAPTSLATPDGRDALAALAALPLNSPPGRIDAEWALVIRLAKDALLGRGLPVAALLET